MKSARERALNRLLLFLAATAVLTMAGACASVEQFVPPEGATDGDLTFEPGTYAVKDGTRKTTEYAADRGFLLVPENRSVPDSRLIALPVIRIHALADDPGEPIFHLAGGPGGSNMSFSHLKGLIDDHDIVMVGYRGVDGSVSLDLPEVSKAWKGKGDDLFSETSIQNVTDAFGRGAKRLQDEGVDIHGYTMIEVVDDMEAARIALGYQRINLLSESYGTRLAQFYAYRYPESLFRSAMISVNPPGHFLWEPDVVDQLIAHDAGLLAEDPEWSQRTPDLAATMRKVTQEMPDRWLFVPIDAGKVRFLTHFMLFHRGSAAAVYDTYIGAEHGDYSGLAMMSLAFGLMMPNALNWGDWASKGAPDYTADRDYLEEMLAEGSIIGAPASVAGSAARGWPATDIPVEFRQAQPSDVETLLISGNSDFSTPSQFARDELLPVLENGEQVVLSEFGHTGDVWGLQPDAVVCLLTTFYENGKADDSLFTYQPMDFDAGPSYRSMAKLGLAAAAGGIVTVAGLTALTIWLLAN